MAEQLVYTEHEDHVAKLRASSDGQAELTVAGETLLSSWACIVCLLPTGGKTRKCQHHGRAGTFIREVRFKS